MSSRLLPLLLVAAGLLGACHSVLKPSPQFPSRKGIPWEWAPPAAMSPLDAPTLVSHFADPDPAIRAGAAWRLSAASPGPVEVQALERLLDDPDPTVRDHASLAMYRNRHPWLTPILETPPPVASPDAVEPSPTPCGAPCPVEKPPRLLRQQRPVYPTEAAVSRVEGMVLVAMLVSATGRVLRVVVVESVPGLDDAALENVRQWEFHPATRDGRNVPAVVYGEVRFRLL